MKSFFVDIAGPSCSGKTTLVKALIDKVKFDFELIHLDDYWDRDFKPPLINGYKNRELPENLKLDLLFLHLQELKSGKSVEIPYRAFEVEDEKRIVQPKKIIFVEGFLLFYKKEIGDSFDFKIYIDLSDEEIVKRGTERNRSNKNDEFYYRNIVISEYKKYGLPAKKKADLILNGEKDVNENVEVVLSKIANFKSLFR